MSLLPDNAVFGNLPFCICLRMVGFININITFRVLIPATTPIMVLGTSREFNRMENFLGTASASCGTIMTGFATINTGMQTFQSIIPASPFLAFATHTIIITHS